VLYCATIEKARAHQEGIINTLAAGVRVSLANSQDWISSNDELLQPFDGLLQTH